MRAAAPFDGRSYVVDTSAWARVKHPEVAPLWKTALLADQVLITPIVRMELLYSTRDATEFMRWEERLAALSEAPLDHEVADLAVTAMRDLAGLGPLHHRVPVKDILIAAAAARRGVGVLHYDGDFDRLAAVLDFESRWVLAPGAAA